MERFDASFQQFTLILARLIGLVFIAPIFNADMITYRLRLVIAFLISIVIFPVASRYLPPLPHHPIELALMAGGQALIGVIIGFMITVIFAAFQISGEIFSVQAGISFSEVLDPQSQQSMPIIGTLKNMIGLLLFLTVDFDIDGVYVPAFQHMIRAVALSFQFVPQLVPDDRIMNGLLSYMDQTFGAMFLTALKIGIPVVGILFISSVALGLLGRAAPQMNLMNMGIQINIIVGLLLLLTLMPVLMPIMSQSFHIMFDRVGDMMRTWPRT